MKFQVQERRIKQFQNLISETAEQDYLTNACFSCRDSSLLFKTTLNIRMKEDYTAKGFEEICSISSAKQVLL